MTASCERYHEAIGDLVDATLSSVDRRELEDHLAVCPECRALADDLRRLRTLARGLESRVPPPALWQRIERAIEKGPGQRRTFSWNWGASGLAAAALIIAAIGVTVWRQPGAAPATPERRDEAPMSAIELANSVEAELRLAEQHYENAIVGLERLARDRQVLDPQIAATLQRNLQIIDSAITESRAALRTQPANDSAQQSLFEAFRTKIALLEDTIALLNDIRKNRQAAPDNAASGNRSS
jgi:anti-sigma factor RsiW